MPHSKVLHFTSVSLKLLLFVSLSVTVITFFKAEAQSTIPSSNASLVVDGTLNDELWQGVPLVRLAPSEPGVSPELAGEVRVALRGGYLCLGASVPELGGKVIARSVGYNPIWEKYELGSPPVEDRIRYTVEFRTADQKQTQSSIEINPWGALRVEQDSAPVPKTGIIAAADINSSGWSSEIAIPLEALWLADRRRHVGIRVEQIRSRRALAPECRWRLPDDVLEWQLQGSEAANRDIPAPGFRPPIHGNSEVPLEVGYVPKVPPLEAEWGDPFWRAVPSSSLPRNEFHPRKPHHETEVKWVHDGRTLAVFFRCEEDERITVNTGVRDGLIARNSNHVFLNIATTGSSLLEIRANPTGAVMDAKGTGPRMYEAWGGINRSAWDGNIERHCSLEYGAWYVRLNLPLNEMAAALGEEGIPAQWRVLVGRVRVPMAGDMPEESTIPVIGHAFFQAPARYRRLNLSGRAPTRVKSPELTHQRPLLGGLAKELSELTSFALSPVERKYHDVREMLQRKVTERIHELAVEEQREWEAVKTLNDWEQFRDKKIAVLKASLGEFPAKRTPLQYQVTGTYEGDGYQVKNIVFQSRPSVYVAANLYLPTTPTTNMPSIVIIPGFHYPKNHGELKDSGIVWARAGCSVLILDRLGTGERIETLPWFHQQPEAYYLIEMQLHLVGQSQLGWNAWDITRAADLLAELGNIDPERMILIGSVTVGGAIPAAVAAIFEQRFDAVIPFNYGRVYWRGFGIRNGLGSKITPWFLYNAVAPRKFVYASEFWFEGDNPPEFPSVWVPAWPRFRKVYELYRAEENLAVASGTGLIEVFELASHCYHLGGPHRKTLFPIFNKWFSMPYPTKEDQSIAMDSELRSAQSLPDLSVVKYNESARRMPDTVVRSITPAVNAQLDRKPLHKMIKEIGLHYLESARATRSQLPAPARRKGLMSELERLLGDIDPIQSPKVKQLWSKELPGVSIEALAVESEPGILVPTFLLKPRGHAATPLPVILALSEGGKARFLTNRSEELAVLLAEGIAVCIPDVRGTGETAPNQYHDTDILARTHIELGQPLLGLRLKDARTVLTYLRTRADVSPTQVGVWGDSFAPSNVEDIWVDELRKWPVSPQLQRYSSPLGAHLAALLALYHSEVKALAMRGGLAGYVSLLDSSFMYMPHDMIVPEILKVGDVNDILAALAPTPLLIDKCVDARNFLLETEELQGEFSIVHSAYSKTRSPLRLIVRKEAKERELVTWLIEQIKR